MYRSILALALIACCTTVASAIPHFLFDDLGFTHWRATWQQAVQESQQTGKPIYVQITHNKCKTSAEYCLKHFSNWKIQSLLRRYFVCYTCDYYKLPIEIARLRGNVGYNHEQTPLHLVMSPKLEDLGWQVLNASLTDMERLLIQAASNKRFQMSKQQIVSTEKAVIALEQALKSNDSRQIAASWQSFLRIPGYSDAKNKGFALLEAAEDPARKKLYAAALMIRDQKYPLAQLALEEARQLAGPLPIAAEAQQSLDCMKLIQQAVDINVRSASSKQQQQVKSLYQQVVSKYPENFLATFAWQKLLKSQ